MSLHKYFINDVVSQNLLKFMGKTEYLWKNLLILELILDL